MNKVLGPPDGGGRSDEPTTRANHTGAGRRGPVWQKWDTVLPESRRCQAEARRRLRVVVARKQHVWVEHMRGIECVLDPSVSIDLCCTAHE
jgi:hypothetical protein